jgi:hypothetical protein
MDGLSDALNDALAQFGHDLLLQLNDALQSAFSTWMSNSAPSLFGRLLTMAIGALAQWLWQAAGGALGGFNLFTQLPPMWSYELRPAVELRDRLGPLAKGLVGLAFLAGIGWGAVCLATGRTFSRVVGALPTFLLATGGLLAAPTLCKWWIDFANAASASLMNPSSGLPGLEQVRGWEYESALGVVALVYLVVAVLMLLTRLKLVVIVCLLLVVAPIALASAALPVPLAQRFFSWWLATFAGAVFVQVLQAVCFGLGAALLAAPFVTGGVEGPAEAVLSASIGIGSLLAAMALPGMLLGSLARAGLAPGVLGSALQAGTLLAGFGLPLAASMGAAGAAASAGRAAVWPVAPPALPAPSTMSLAPVGGYVRSVLLLPAPKD